MANAATETTKTRIKFENPPINELSIGASFLPITDLKSQHVGIYWNLIRDRYPLCEQQPPIVFPSSIGNMPLTASQVFQEVPGELFPLPRFWFFGDKHPLLIQIQRNAFVLNWRRQANGEYPHYEAVLQEFFKELDIYSEFLRELANGKIDVLQRCELTYVNVVEPNAFFADASQIQGVVPSLSGLCDLQAEKRQLAELTTNVTYRVSPTLFVELAARLGRRADTKAIVMVLELKAHGAPNDLSLDEAASWYAAAHDATYQLFLDATSKQMQETVWKPH